MRESIRERRSREIRTARVNRRPAGLGATLMAFTIVFALAWVFFIRQPPQAPTPSIKAVAGTYEWRPGGRPADENGTFGAVASGNAGGRAETPKGTTVVSSRPPESAYDAGGRSETTLRGGGPFPSATRTVGAWPPVWRVATHSPLDYQGLAAVVRTAVEDGDHTVGYKPLKDGDRDVWRAAMTIDRTDIEVVVDQLSGLVLWYTDGHSTFTANVDWVSPPPVDESYAVDLPAGTKVETTTDHQYAYAQSPAAAGRTAGYDPLFSDLAPDGYVMKAVATTRTPGAPVGWLRPPISLPADVAPKARQIAMLYTRGLNWFTVEQAGPEIAGPWAQTGSGLKPSGLGALSLQETTLQYGALAGRSAYTWYTEQGPALVTGDARHIVYITGALTRQELIDFANGLKPVVSGATTGGGSPSPSTAPSP